MIKATHISRTEGAPWEPWVEGKDDSPVHAIKWSNGVIWDTYNGWRGGWGGGSGAADNGGVSGTSGASAEINKLIEAQEKHINDLRSIIRLLEQRRG